MDPVKTFQGHTEPITCMAISLDGKYLLSGSGRGEDGVRYWRVDSGALLHAFPTEAEDAVRGVAFSPDGTFVAAATRVNNVMLWNRAVRHLVGAVPSQFGAQAVLFPRDGAFILSAHGRRYTRYNLSLQPIREHDNLQHGPIDSPSLSPEGRFVASVHTPDGGPNLIVYDLLEDQPVLKVTGDPTALFNAVAFAPDGRALLTGDVRGQLKLLNATTGQLERSFAGPGHSRLVRTVAVSPNGRLALSGSEDFSVKLWEVATGKDIHTLEHGGGFVTCVGFSPDSKFALSGGYDQTLKLWDLSAVIP